MKNTTDNELTLIAVKQAVYSWSIRFKSAGYGNEQLARISQEYLEDLQSEGVTVCQFDAAVKTVRKRCRFFPSMAEILDAVDDFRSSPPKPIVNQNQIEATTSLYDLTPEEIERNKARMKHITDMLAGKMSMDQAVEAVSKSGHIGEFGQQEAQQAKIKGVEA